MTLPALTQEIPCSVLRPPNTTATRVFRGVLTRQTLPCVHTGRFPAGGQGRPCAPADPAASVLCLTSTRIGVTVVVKGLPRTACAYERLREGRDMDVTRATEIVVIMLSPTLVVGAVLYAPRAIRAIRRLISRPRPDDSLRPAYPPIEEIAADLRRLLRQYETVRLSPDVAMRVQRLRAIEGALADCAADATRALGLQQPPPGRLTTAQLRQLLLALADAGLTLPAAVGLIAADRRL
jgi:hypothetical protein